MLKKRLVSLFLLITLLASLPLSWDRSQAAGTTPGDAAAVAQMSMGIPEAAWSRPIGEPFENPSHEKVDYTMIDDGPVQGAPLGGLGAGTFTRTYAGDFARWNLNGMYQHGTNPADMFSVYTKQGDQTVAQALWTGKPDGNALSAWQWGYPVGAGTYYALYPRSWFVYDWDQLPVDLSVEQFSPILPDNYQESSYPIALFNWTATNPSDQAVTVGVMFTWQNTLGPRPGRMQWAQSEDTPAGRMVGVVMGRDETFANQVGRGTVALAALEVPGVTVSYNSNFNVASDGADIWNDFADDGALSNTEDPTPSEMRGPLPGVGVAITFELQPGQTITAPFAMAWDMPVMTFGEDQSWYKRYTAFYGRDSDNAWQIAADGLANVENWQTAIDTWQEPILSDSERPLWYKTALFNELYYVADGGTIWEHGRVGEADPGADYMGHFGYLECPDYAFYNTFDVDFYASYVFLELWPEIETRIMRDFAANVPEEDTSTFIVGYDGSKVQRKVKGAVSHDAGGPGEAPWVKYNAFTWQNVNGWKDLNSKFVLRLYRDAVLLDQPELVSEMWDVAVTAMDYLGAMDQDGDGIPENAGIPDQTYDTWPATGVSAYSGGLWVASLAAMSEMAKMVGDQDAADQYAAQFQTAQARYEAVLWNGDYYNYDQTSDAIMAGQVVGDVYEAISGIPTLPQDHVDSALNTVYTHNVMLYNEGQMGAINGMYPDGTVVDSEQAAEVWSGTSYLVAAHMLLRGLDEQAWGTAYGLYKFVYETGGMWFRTPEAWNNEGFRASMYMRPLAIWSIETVLEMR